MKGNTALDVGQAPTLNRGRAVFIAFAVLTLLIVSALVSISLHEQKSTKNNLANLISFTCRPSSSNQTFTINVGVNLTDNMNQDEAIVVAFKVYERSISMPVNPTASFSLTAHECADGIWLVEFNMAYTISSYCAQRRHVFTRILREIFVATINPFLRTVVYMHVCPW